MSATPGVSAGAPAFRPISSDLDLGAMEAAIADFWDRERIFARSVAERAGAPHFVFYEGPPTANGLPGVHHVFSRSIKDAICRYQTMRGRRVDRKAGWDTHGLQVEIEVEKALGMTSKDQIEAYGVARFNDACRKSVFEYVDAWRAMTRRIAYWVDFDQAYITLQPEYVESVWWALSRFWDAGLIYRGHKVLPYCPRCGTPLSSHEVAQGYDDADDPSIVVTLPLTPPGETEPADALVWTTTPWTLPSNVAIAVNPDAMYVLLQAGGRRVLVAESRVDFVREWLGDTLERVRTYAGRELTGLRYAPLFRFVDDARAFRVIAEDFVSLDDGTGIVHMAPAFGADDYEASRRQDLPVFRPVDGRGRFTEEVPDWQGAFIKDADPQIIERLRADGRLLHAGRLTHTYPFCWRCDSPLIYYARDSWYIATTRYKDDLLRAAGEIEWHPGDVGENRFTSWLRGNVDWAISRDRYWGTPLPVWICAECDARRCVDARAALASEGRLLAEGAAVPARWADVQGDRVPGDVDPHKPLIDRVVLPCACGGTMVRTPEVIDAWFDSGSMPFAQWHAPFENEDARAAHFPADFIAEGIDQTRGWFYSLLAISAFLWKRTPYRHVIANSHVVDRDGQKMSKSRGNTVDPMALMDEEGADTLRWYLLSASLQMPLRFDPDGVREVRRRVLGTLRNTAAFFTLYANIDGWRPGERVAHVAADDMDRWILSRLDATVERVRHLLDVFDLTRAARTLGDFLVDDVSNWYVRRNRRRFWRSAESERARADKAGAYATLHEVLETTCRMLAPFLPFAAEDIYRSLVSEAIEGAPSSVHLASFPEPVPGRRDADLDAHMQTAREVVELGRAARSTSGRRVRQPLGRLSVAPASEALQRALARTGGIIAEELNVQSVWAVAEEEIVTLHAKGLKSELGPKHGKRLPLVSAAIAALSSERVSELAQGRPVALSVEGEEVSVEPGDVEVRREPRGPVAIAGGSGGFTVAVETTLTPELVAEGLVREFAHRIQNARKAADYRVTDRIRIRYAASPGLAQALGARKSEVCDETLAVALEAADLADGAGEAWRFDGEDVRVVIERVEAPGTGD